MVHGKLGEFPEALENYEAALALKLELGDKKGEADTLLNLAGAAPRETLIIREILA